MPRFLTAAIILTAMPVFAAPRVATDIAAVHSLAFQVMDGVGAPDLIMPPGASPHGYSMRPSEAAALQDADVVFWIGEELTPWLERSLENLNADAVKVELLAADGIETLPFREGATFEAHDDHGDGHDDEHEGEHKEDEHEDHAEHKDEHEDHAEHKGEHEDHADHKGDDGHEDHADEDGHEGHDHDGVDPHAWLSPEIAKSWLDLMATTLAANDPENAAAYAANAMAAKARIEAKSMAIKEQLAPVNGAKFVVFHDAYQYFEHHFDMPAAGSIALSDASKPGPARIAEIRDYVKDGQITCVFSEPQFDAGIINAVFEGTTVKSGVLDPLGSALTPGAEFYGQLLDSLANPLSDCLTN